MWAVELANEPHDEPALPHDVVTGNRDTYDACRAEARRLRERGAAGLVAPSAALLPGTAAGWRVDGGLIPGPRRDGRILALFGRRPDLVGWLVTVNGQPGADLLASVRSF